MAIWQNDWLPYRENERQRIGVNHLQRFPGQILDEETGLYDNTTESTEPHTSRYTQSDPIRFEDSIHAYAYVGGNPIMRIDPLGLWWFDDPLPQGLVDSGVGLGDGVIGTLSLGFIEGRYLRSKLNIDGEVNLCSNLYKAGRLTGTAATLLAYSYGQFLSN